MREIIGGKSMHDVVEVQGIKTSYIKEGDPHNNLVLFIHGWGGTKETWQPFLKPIATDRFFTVAIDLPGFGESENPGTWGVENYSRFLERLIGKLGKNRVSLVG